MQKNSENDIYDLNIKDNEVGPSTLSGESGLISTGVREGFGWLDLGLAQKGCLSGTAFPDKELDVAYSFLEILHHYFLVMRRLRKKCYEIIGNLMLF